MSKRWRFVVALVVGVVLFGCDQRHVAGTDAAPLSDTQSDQARPDPDVGPPAAVDILFVGTQDVACATTRSSQIGVVTGLPRALAPMLKRIALADIRVASVSPLIFGISRCQSGVVLPPTARLFVTSKGRRFASGEDSSDEWQAVLQGSPEECHLQNYLEVATLAIDGRNPGFPRKDALLVIIIGSAHDDCSIENMKLWDDASLWPATYMTNAKCASPPAGLLVPLERYGPRIRAAHPHRTLVVALGYDQPVVINTSPTWPNGEMTVRPLSCNDPSYPTPRLARFVETINTNPHSLLRGAFLEGVCERPAPAIGALSRLIAQAMVEYGEL